jgi:hypothetical protein
LQQYDDLKAARCRELDPLVYVLGKIAENPSLAAMVAGDMMSRLADSVSRSIALDDSKCLCEVVDIRAPQATAVRVSMWLFVRNQWLLMCMS